MCDHCFMFVWKFSSINNYFFYFFFIKKKKDKMDEQQQVPPKNCDLFDDQTLKNEGE